MYWSESDNHWFITRYTDLTSLIRDERMSSDRFRAVAASLPEESKERLSALIGAVSSWMLMPDRLPTLGCEDWLTRPLHPA